MLYKLEIAQSNLKNNKAFFKKLKSIKNQGNIDTLFHEAHHEVFSKTDCLQCANCCKTTGPLFSAKDIERISKSLKLKPGNFVDKYLRIDEDNDYVLKEVPCAFLGPDNYCSIYDNRPKACREYPHTDRIKQKAIFNLHLKNSTICPAVSDIISSVKAQSTFK